MMKAFKYSLIFSMISLIVTFMSLIPLTFASETSGTRIIVVPAKSVFYSGSTPVDTEFSVNVSVVDGVNVWNWQVNFTFDPTMLECVSAIIPADSPFNFPVAPEPVIDNDNGYVLIGASKIGTQPPVNASGVLATITLKIKQAPTTSTPLTCPLNLTEGTRLKDNTMTTIPATLEPGYYEYWYSEVLVHEIQYGNQTFTVITESNVTLTPVPMIFEPEAKRLRFNVTGTEGGNGFVGITIPYNLMHDDWEVTVDGTQVTSEISSNSTHTTLYFVINLTGGDQQVHIYASWVVPEFSTGVLLLILILSASSIIGVNRKLKFKKNL